MASLKRLTDRQINSSDRYYMNCSKTCIFEFDCQENCDCEELDQLIDRLGKIEDILGDEYDLDRLRELVEADRDGRCVLLPCKVGDRIYKLFCGDVIELEVERIVRWSSGFWKLNANTNKTLTDWKGFEIDFADFGKTVFLTSEAAEAALKGKRDG